MKVSSKSAKRKRKDSEQTEPVAAEEALITPSKDPKESKSKRKPSTEATSSETADKPPAKKRKGPTEPDKPPKEPSKRYLLFVGNLPHQPSEKLLPALKAHFPTEPTQIRIPTKKSTNAPQGFAFVEFDTAPALEKALRCHHTVLLGRKINVELTAGGGGHGEYRTEKIRKRNEGLEEERQRRLEEERKEKEKKGEKTEGPIHPDRLKK
jgi:nucleolar protein 6